jgi:hypothetical protein
MLATVAQCKSKGYAKPVYYNDIEEWYKIDADAFNKKLEILEKYKEKD